MQGSDAPVVLVTGFGPYPKVRVNPTATLARAVAGSPRLRRLGLSARAHVFETSYAAAGAQAPGVIAAAAPVACLHLGLAPRERMLRVETRGENRTRVLSPDVRGNRPALRALRPGSPAALRSAAPLGAVLATLRRAGLKARLSNDAGAYLCNAMYFWSLDEARASGTRRPVVFVHLPRPAPAPGTLPRRRRQTPRPPRRTSRPPSSTSPSRWRGRGGDRGRS